MGLFAGKIRTAGHVRIGEGQQNHHPFSKKKTKCKANPIVFFSFFFFFLHSLVIKWLPAGSFPGRIDSERR